MTRPISRRRPWLLLVGLLLSFGVLYVCLSGYAMAASFSVAHPEQLAYWRRTSVVYLAGGGLSLVGIVACGVALWRRILASAPAERPRAV